MRKGHIHHIEGAVTALRTVYSRVSPILRTLSALKVITTTVNDFDMADDAILEAIAKLGNLLIEAHEDNTNA